MSRPADPYADPPRLPEGDEVDVRAFVGGEGPLELEIGPGRGAFIFERCKADPTARILGIEIRRKWATRVDERIHREGWATRARVVCGDARRELSRLRPDAAFDRVYIHFPDPWWKKRHMKRAVIGDALIEEIARLLRVDGELFVQTDVSERAEQYASVIEQTPSLRPAGDDGPAVEHNPYDARSNRERRVAEDGLPVYRLWYRRVAMP